MLARAAGGEAEILTLAVAPGARGTGAGPRACCRPPSPRRRHWGAEAMFLEVGADNPAALALYAGLGFAKVGTRKGYYARRQGCAGAQASAARQISPNLIAGSCECRSRSIR